MSTYLKKDFSGGSLSDQRTWTWAAWVKRAPGWGGDDDYENYLWSALYDDDTSYVTRFYFQPHESSYSYKNRLRFQKTGGTEIDIQTNRVFRDYSAWYHIVLQYDSTQVTESDRVKIWINGVQETSLATSTYPSLNLSCDINTLATQYIGDYGNPSYVGGSYGLFGYFSHIHHTTGTAYPASSFGSVDSTSGIWKPNLGPSITYGDYGYFLKFENSGASAAAGNFGSDSSGEDNHFASYNLGAHPNTTDTPENNFCTGNPADNYYPGSTYSLGNLKVVSKASAYAGNPATVALEAGKWYWEVKCTTANTDFSIGITGHQNATDTQWIGSHIYSTGYYSNGDMYNNGSATSGYGATYTAGDIISVALDLTNSKLYFAKNGSWQDSGDPAAGTNGFTIASVATMQAASGGGGAFPAIGGYVPAWSDQSSSQSNTAEWNFGNPVAAITSSNADDADYGNFEYDVPAGFYSICTQNLATYG